LDTIPREEQWLVKIVEDVDDNVVVGGAVDGWPREHAIDENDLLRDAQG
jgi:hypothetical protein